MTFEVLDRLDEEFTSYAFGTNKDGDVYVGGKKTGFKVEGNSVDDAYKMLKKKLLKKKFIKYEQPE